MNIPLDNLYHWIQGLAQHPVILYVFRPHGSKDIFDMGILGPQPNLDSALAPVIVCHDQEPLDFAVHQFDHDLDRVDRLLDRRNFMAGEDKESMMSLYQNLLLFPKYKPNWLNIGISFNDWVILLHSEQNSTDVDQFAKNGFIPVYYWSHAVISRDWFRFAINDIRLDARNVNKTFLVYCRDWMPRREYRLKFLDLLVDSDMTNDCIVSTQHTNSQGVHLRDYKIHDQRFAVNTQKLLCIPNNTSSSTASADYDVKDITTTAVSVVLETVVDGDKIHLTEKILRPIACAHPFLLLAGPGALAYLRSYGFQTFAEFWDESYDQETDTIKRIEMIIDVMKQIQMLPKSQWLKINNIAEQNKQHFFSEDFIQQVKSELESNLTRAVDFYLENRGDTYWAWRKFVRRSKLLDPLHQEMKSEISKNSIRELRRHRSRQFQNKSSPVITERLDF